jgi:hypothetical protein
LEERFLSLAEHGVDLIEGNYRARRTRQVLQPLEKELHGARPVRVVDRDAVSLEEWCNGSRNVGRGRHIGATDKRGDDARRLLQCVLDLLAKDVFRAGQSCRPSTWIIVEPMWPDEDEYGIGRRDVLENLSQELHTERDVIDVLPHTIGPVADDQVIA